MRREEEKTPLLTLINGAGKVVNHPLLQKFVDAAPSANAAEEYFKALGWPQKLRQRVRHAVRLREKYPDTWRDFKLREPDTSRIVKFTGPSAPFSQELVTNQGIFFDEFLFDTSDWPLMLREFSNKGDRQRKRNVTSFDSVEVLKNPDEEKLFDFFAPDQYNLNTDSESFAINGQDNRSGVELLPCAASGLLLRTKCALVYLKTAPFPILYKIAQIDFHHEDPVLGDERVRLMIRLDWGPDKDLRGLQRSEIQSELTYDRFCAIPSTTAHLQAKYFVLPHLKCAVDGDPERDRVSVTLNCKGADYNFQAVEAVKVMAQLTRTATKFYLPLDNKRLLKNPKLEDIFGDIWNGKHELPKTLSELFY